MSIPLRKIKYFFFQEIISIRKHIGTIGTESRDQNEIMYPKIMFNKLIICIFIRERPFHKTSQDAVH